MGALFSPQVCKIFPTTSLKTCLYHNERSFKYPKHLHNCPQYPKALSSRCHTIEAGKCP